MYRTIFTTGVFYCVSLVLSGCNQGRPRLIDDRPLAVQRQQIQQFDPYPDNDIAPEVVGGRPPGFQQPPVEPYRSRWTLPNGRFFSY